MPQTHRDEKTSSNEALLITLYKSVITERAKSKRRDFIVWGSSNFLYVEPIQSLSQFSLAGNEVTANSIESSFASLAENRYLLIYRDPETSPVLKRNLRWIFNPDWEDYPLIVITLLQSNNLRLISDTVGKKALLNKFEFDIFRTLGHGNGVLVLRCKTYSHALESLIQLNTSSENTYSIAGVQNPQDSKKTLVKMNGILFPKLLEVSGTNARWSRSIVSINYMLKEEGISKNLVADILATEIQSMNQKILHQFNISEKELKVISYYEIGRYDIEVRIEGSPAYILELLLNLRYGLANIDSDFYKKYIFESHTTWKTDATSDAQ